MALDLAERVNFLSYVYFVTCYCDIDKRHRWPTRSDTLRRDAFYMYALFASVHMPPERIVFGYIIAIDAVNKRTSGYEDSLRRNFWEFPVDDAADLFARALRIVTQAADLSLRPHTGIDPDIYVRVGRMCDSRDIPEHVVPWLETFQAELAGRSALQEFLGRVQMVTVVAAARKMQAYARLRRIRLRIIARVVGFAAMLMLLHPKRESVVRMVLAPCEVFQILPTQEARDAAIQRCTHPDYDADLAAQGGEVGDAA